MVEKVFVPHELRTIEVDVEKKIFRINGEDFGKGCTGFTIWCDTPDIYNVRVEISTKVQYATYHRKDRASFAEHPVTYSWHSD